MPALAVAQSLAELYGQDAPFENMAMSSSGKAFASTQVVDGEKYVVVTDLETSESIVLAASDDKMRGYKFYDDDYLVITQSLTTGFTGYRGEYEFYAAIAVNRHNGKSKQLLRRVEGLLYPQLDLSTIYGVGAKPGTVLMGVRRGETQEGASWDLFRVNLDSGRATRLKRGSANTQDWFVDENEVIYGREDFSNDRDHHRVRALSDGRWVDIFEEDTELAKRSFMGVTPDRSSLVMITSSDSGEGDAYYEVSLEDGSMSDPLFVKEGHEIDEVYHQNGIALGVRYSGLTPTYAFYDQDLTDDMAKLTRTLAESSVQILDFVDNQSQVLVYISGNDMPGAYALFNREKGALEVIANERPFAVELGHGKIEVANVIARDGLEFKALATYPNGIEPGSGEASNLPTIVLPHGGPESYDAIGFNYMAQFFAQKGYLVIQPNFRGSTGFGYHFRNAGRGKWGKEMQDDITDSLSHFVEAGVADPERVCIVGYSYGGYAALAGGAFTPDLYKCVIAGAPVSDLPMMLNQDRSKSRFRNHWAVAYWERVIGDSREERERLKDVSPANFAESFQAPVLLLHGDDDTVVPIAQSRRMEARLKRADKQVEFVRLKGEDHWLSIAETRIQALEAMGSFLDKHLPVENPESP